MNKILIYILIILGAATTNVEAQRLTNPFNFPIQLSGGFCDLRAGHYHAGIDIRTKSTEGHAIHAVSSGYISRISVSPSGYGLALYVTHPEDSIITVYGHLQRYTFKITEIVRKRQYENESYSVNILLDPDDLPVKQGDIIGYSGNSGSSGGPHLHFEVRDMRNNNYLDPLAFYKTQIPDKQKPLVRGLKIYPIEGKGMVNGGNKKQDIAFSLDKNNNPVISTTIEAWGEIGLSVRAVDRMDGTSFSYGIKKILQTVDSVETYLSEVDKFSPNESRYINSYTDYEEWSEKRAFYIKTFVEPGNGTRFVAWRDYGRININEERTYSVIITLTDMYNNTCKIPIKIIGKKQEITPPDTIGTKLLRWYEPNSLNLNGIQLTTPDSSLYSNLYMRYDSFRTAGYYSPVHVLHNSPVPLHNSAKLSIRLDSLSENINTSRLGIVRINRSDGRMSWIGGKYRDGWMEADISELGAYTVAQDITPPVIRPLNPESWRGNKRINIRITDNFSGIFSFRGEIDGKYALFEYDSKNSLLTYSFDDKRLSGGRHQLKLTVIDRSGNKSVYEYSFSR